MSYSRSTNFFKIPFMGVGDIMTEQENEHQMSIIDRLLFANNFGLNNYFLEQGNYTYQKFGSYYNVIISPNVLLSSENANENNLKTENFSLAGVLNHRLFYELNPIRIEDLFFDNTYYIYLYQYVDEDGKGLENNPSSFKIIVSGNKQELNDSIIPLCIITTNSNNIIIEKDIDDKMYAKNINTHVFDTTNPHGRKIYQDNMDISETLTVHEEKVIGSRYINFQSNNDIYEYNFPEKKKIIFATAYAQDLGVNIAWSIDNINKKIIFKTSGNIGITINVKLDLENE